MTAPAADRADRDRTIAVNSYTTVLGRRSLAEDDFRAYWRDVHGPLCSRIPGLGWYVQHHFSRHHDSHLWPTPDGVEPFADYDLDGMVEIGWAGEQEQQTFQDASSLLFSDEQNVFEETAAYPLPQGSTTLLDRSLDPTPNGPDRDDRLHVHLAPRAGREDELVERLTSLFTALADDTDDLVKVRLHRPEPHDNSSPNPPAPRVRHTVPDERVRLVVLEVAFSDPLARRRVQDSPAFRAFAEDQARLATHVAAFHVQGVHTFVRDGRLTTAGLRGSRVAELISGLAAQNQVGDDVSRLFQPHDGS
ncbi:EthD domain-containing protein [Microlunatus sagamiharensis]|uniref:EthD domain-containing protein n=1 Tax=Microlunatus sagamiharensis TaxID=546874 RepID=A0A1H2LZT1_9ACTN|nr:EthD domain-containing protein [Microlunatus sagamiharensis]SDU86141.1 EthD domain-containing protein [Microlunatus sagamiharensis]